MVKYITCPVCGKQHGYDTHKTHAPKTCSISCGKKLMWQRRQELQALPETKQCPRCGIEKPFTLQFFPPSKQRSSGLYAYCRECNNKKRADWAEANPDKLALSKRTSSLNRRSRKFGINEYISVAVVRSLLASQSNLCAYCKAQLTDYHVDHINPVARGGTNDIANLCIACPSCNHSKWASTLEEWKIRRPDLFPHASNP